MFKLYLVCTNLVNNIIIVTLAHLCKLMQVLEYVYMLYILTSLLCISVLVNNAHTHTYTVCMHVYKCVCKVYKILALNQALPGIFPCR